jgi:hypothetical protein
VGILHADGTIAVEYIPTDEDLLVAEEVDIIPEANLDQIREFVGSLAHVTTDKTLDFRQTVKRYAETADINPETYNTIMEAVDGNELTIIQTD